MSLHLNMEDHSASILYSLPIQCFAAVYKRQKKKVLLARSICQDAHLHIWDEPMNYIDIISRMQIEELLLRFKPTILFVEHDRMFCENVATKIIQL